MPLASEKTYSRFVVLAKITLPLVALATLSSLFLFSKTNDSSSIIRLSDADLAEFASAEHITKPRFAGMTPDGVAIQLSAKEASPRANDSTAFDASQLKALVELPDGETVNVVAARGSVVSVKRLAVLTDDINLKTSYGYTATTHGLEFSLDKVDIRSQGAISAFGPLGKITAGSFFLGLDETDTTSKQPGIVLVFKTDVRLLYIP